jgi:hypothetical protein
MAFPPERTRATGLRLAKRISSAWCLFMEDPIVTTTPIHPPNATINTACAALDQVISLFLDARRTLPQSKYEADFEAVNLFNLVIRHVEGVLALARSDLVLAPPAYACARAAFETAAKAAWIVNADDPF